MFRLIENVFSQTIERNDYFESALGENEKYVSQFYQEMIISQKIPLVYCFITMQWGHITVYQATVFQLVECVVLSRSSRLDRLVLAYFHVLFTTKLNF